MGLCPFHAEKTPSFNVHEARQFFHCFGCGEKGDVFTFVTKIEQRPFTEVLRDLARDAGVDLPEKAHVARPSARRWSRRSPRSERMLRAVEAAVAFFEEQLQTPAGAAARAYIERPGHLRRRRQPLPPWLCPGGLGRASEAPRRTENSPRHRRAAGSGGGERARPLRLLPRPGDVAGARSAEAPDRVLLAPARSRGQGPQVRQLARLAAVPQEGAALRPARRPGRHPRASGGRWWSRATSTCCRCTRRASTEAVAPMGTALTAEQVGHAGAHGGARRDGVRRRQRRRAGRAKGGAAVR